MFKKHIVYICFVMVSFLYLPALGGGCVVGGNIGPPDGLNQNNGGEKSISDTRERTPAEKTTEAIAEDKGDASAKEESPTETAPEKETDCAKQGGYCEESSKSCKQDHTPSSVGTLGCPGGKDAQCCLPTQPTCGQLGATISTSENCCTGLTKAEASQPPGCNATGKMFVCIQCGDGKCDASNGENECTCPKDCKNTQSQCEAQGGRCIDESTICNIDEKVSTTACGKQEDTCCVKASANCKTHCDCQQGASCQGGKCLLGTKPTYCCDKSGCPQGEACVDSVGSTKTCPAPVTDCSKKGGICTTQGQSCPKDYKTDATSCGAALGLTCCLPVTDKCATVKCAGPTCNVQSNKCTATSTKCDPATGKCVTKTTNTSPSCSMNGTSCEQVSPTCSGTTCSTSSSQKDVSCRMSGTTCIQSNPSCGSDGLCKTSDQSFANYICNSNGTCEKPECNVDCDCKQGQSCTKGKCVTGSSPAYCCSKANCPSDKACTDSKGQSGTCPKVDKCATVKCSPPSCSVSSGTCNSASYTCDPATGNCVKSSKTSSLSCSMNSTSCVQTTPICSSNACATRKTTTSRSCNMSGTTCVQSNPGCSSGGSCTIKKVNTVLSCSMNSTNTTCTQKTPACSGDSCSTKTSTKIRACSMSGTTCVQSNPSCSSGGSCTTKSVSTKLSCSMNSGSTTCTETKPACSGSQCVTSKRTVSRSCTMSGTSCVQSSPTCATSGACGVTKKTNKRTCLMNSGVCEQTNPSCSGGVCGSSKTSVKKSCTQSGNICTQKTPGCSLTGTCTTSTTQYTDYNCTSTGVCIRQPTLDCVKAGGRCYPGACPINYRSIRGSCIGGGICCSNGIIP